jgi:aminomethyltransferase
LAGLEISGQPLDAPNTRFWPLFAGDEQVGYVTSAAYSPRLERNIALAMVSAEYASAGFRMRLFDPGDSTTATVVDTPFLRPPEQLTQVFDKG